MKPRFRFAIVNISYNIGITVINDKWYEMWHQLYNNIYNTDTSPATTSYMLRGMIMFLSLKFLFL